MISAGGSSAGGISAGGISAGGSPAGDDLRGFVELVRRTRPADIVDVEREVSPRYETAAIITRLEAARRGPIVVFHRVRGSSMPVITNVAGSTGRLALALGCGLRDVSARYAQAAAQPIAPELVADAPVQQEVHRGASVDLGRLPALVYHEGDSDRPYLTAAIVVARDPESGVVNLSYHRLMIAGRDRTGIYMEPGRHLHGIFARWRARGQAMPIAVVVGVHPAWALGALYAGRADEDEYATIGGLIGRPLPVVHTVTGTGLPVPAAAEIVLEGHVAIDEDMDEGPFGEFTGYGTGMVRTPVFHVQAMTHRHDPWLQDIVSGRLEHLLLSLPALELRTRREAGRVAQVVAIALPAPLTAVIAIDKRDDDEPRRVIDAVLGSDIYAKHVIVVDADVDPSDLSAVLSSVALQTQADTKVDILRDRPGSPLDPSCPRDDGRTAKMGIDATRSLLPRRAVTRNRIPAAVLDAVDLDEILGRKKG